MAKIKEICGNCCFFNDRTRSCFKEGTTGSYNPYNRTCGCFDPWENPKYCKKDNKTENQKKAN